MDFKTYITAVEEQLHQMTEAQKTDWIFAKARSIEESQRESFLDDLADRKKTCLELDPDNIFDWCRQIEEGKIYFETEEYYREGAWDDDWEIEYHDIFDIIPYLEKAVHTCFQLLWQKEYDIVFRLLDRIYSLRFATDYEDILFGGDEKLTIKQLAEEGLFHTDFKNMSLCLLYACYQIYIGKSRIDSLYQHLIELPCDTIVLTDVFAYGPDKIEDEELFMKKWHRFLMDIPGNLAAELLVDACIYLGGDDYLLKTAEANVENHPYLYKKCCERKYQCQDYAGCIAIAEAATKHIDDNMVIRADISDIAIESAKKLGNEGQMSYFYQVSFYSDPNSWHLLRLYQLEDKAIMEEAFKRVQGLKVTASIGNTKLTEKKQTVIYGNNTKALYRFLLGDYNDILDKCQKSNTYLGWSSDIKGIVIPLFLLYLKKDGENKTCAERQLIEEIKLRIQFQKGKPFDQYLSFWRKSGFMAEEDKEKYIPWLRREVDQRTKNVVGGGFRHSYYKAAELIVLLGAVLEERGEIKNRQDFVDYYKKQYSRKRAFRSEIDELAKVVS